MQLGIKSPLSITDAQRLSQQCGKPVAARVLLNLTSLTGLQRINECPDGVLLDVNILYDGIGLPLQLSDYTDKFKKAYNQITTKLWMATSENEVFCDKENFNLDMNAAIQETLYIKYTPQSIKVSTSGTPSPFLAAITNQYLTDHVSTDAAAQFRTQWGVPISAAIKARINDVFTEIAMIKARGMQKIFYNWHLNVTRENVKCIPQILEALHFYCRTDNKSSLRMGTNELSFREQSASLVTEALSYIKDKVAYVFAYSNTGSQGESVPFTPDMEAAFLTFV